MRLFTFIETRRNPDGTLHAHRPRKIRRQRPMRGMIGWFGIRSLSCWSIPAWWNVCQFGILVNNMSLP